MKRRRDFRLSCGCRHDGDRWLELCAEHERESAALHRRAQLEHERAAAAAPSRENPGT